MASCPLTARRTGVSLPSIVNEPDIDEIVLRVLSGETEAYGELVRRFQDRLYWAAFKLLGNHEDARDATQDGLVRAFDRLRTFDRGRRFYTWADRIVTNLAIDRLRSRSRQSSSELSDEIAGRDDPPEAMLMGDELRAEVRMTLEALPPRYRALLIQRDVEGVSGKAIAEASGIAHATVRWRIHRARRLFRAAWEKRASRERGGGE
jgi:RNA polymerase sigma-70 factor (ECF subfamily)